MKLAAALLLLCAASVANGQDQERKLVDRILKPDMELKNTAQDRKFYASGTAGEKKTSTRTFQFEDKTRPKTFAGSHSFLARLFHAKSFDTAKQSAFVDWRKSASAGSYAPIKAVSVQQTRDADQKINTRDYAHSTQEFRDRGKSSKSLEQKNQPLTIDQVRELLNKNK